MNININEGSQWCRRAPTVAWSAYIFRVAVWFPFVGYVSFHRLSKRHVAALVEAGRMKPGERSWSFDTQWRFRKNKKK